MPALPLQPNLPAEPAHTHRGEHHNPEIHDLLNWGQTFQRAFIRLWTSMVYVLNALCKADTLANRTAAPDLDETFAYETDTKVLSVGSAGAWEAVGVRRGSATLLSGNTTVAVALDPDEPDADYRLVLTPTYDSGGLWWTSKAATGFTINANTAPGANAVIDWLIARD